MCAHRHFGGRSTSAPGENRTPNLRGRNPLLYPLSYEGVAVSLFAGEQVAAEEIEGRDDAHLAHLLALTG